MAAYPARAAKLLECFIQLHSNSVQFFFQTNLGLMHGQPAGYSNLVAMWYDYAHVPHILIKDQVVAHLHHEQ